MKKSNHHSHHQSLEMTINYPALRVVVGFSVLFVGTISLYFLYKDVDYIIHSGAMIGDIEIERLYARHFFNKYNWLMALPTAGILVFLKQKIITLLDHVKVFLIAVGVYLISVVVYGIMANDFSFIHSDNFVLETIKIATIIGLLSVIIARFILPDGRDIK